MNFPCLSNIRRLLSNIEMIETEIDYQRNRLLRPLTPNNMSVQHLHVSALMV